MTYSQRKLLKLLWPTLENLQTVVPQNIHNKLYINVFTV